MHQNHGDGDEADLQNLARGKNSVAVRMTAEHPASIREATVKSEARKNTQAMQTEK